MTTGPAEKRPGQWNIPHMKAVVVVTSHASGPGSVVVEVVGSFTDEQMKEIIGQAGSIGGWSPGPVSVKHLVFKSGALWEEATGQKAEPQQETLGEFQAAGLVNRATGTLAVKEFVQALRAYAPVRVMYKLEKGFSFSGPEDEDFEGLHIAHHHSDGTHTFDAVAAEEPAGPAASAAPARPRPSRAFPWLGVTLCVVALAMAAGAGVWKWRLGRSQYQTTKERGESSGS